MCVSEREREREREREAKIRTYVLENVVEVARSNLGAHFSSLRRRNAVSDESLRCHHTTTSCH
ncbi:MAG: hypothetical protein VXV85_07960, partial [Candidatus Thermoplasmatota archaeon]|nr:hypothetical protein [Candidatus Thermoplasmatota archaeon]